MTGPADRILATSCELGDSPSCDSEARSHTVTHTGKGGRRRTRRDVLALILGTAALIVVERRSAYAQESSTLAATAPAPEEGSTPPAAADAPSAPTDGAAPVEAAPSPPIAPTTYAVQAGDTLYSIARKHGVSVDAVLWANNMSDANVLKAGQKLTIPPSTGKLHTVKDGDTLDSLAQSYSVSRTGIVAVNGLSEGAGLKAGQRLLIPVTVKPTTNDPAFTPAPLQAASAEEPVPIPQGGPQDVPQEAGTGSPTPPVISSVAPLLQVPGMMTATGAPTVTVINRKVPQLQWPIPPNPPKTGVSQKFHPGHTGIDIYAPQGTPIKAAGSGTIKMAEKYPDGFSGYGWIVIVDHGDGISTWYAHCGSFAVKEGDKVRTGDTLGTVGMTGRTTGPHLHFELRVSASAVDPQLALK
jgi:murein DD-endopeptidase MepM/ murein hydrolase activator NlpD